MDVTLFYLPAVGVRAACVCVCVQLAQRKLFWWDLREYGVRRLLAKEEWVAIGVLGGDGEVARHLLPEAQGEITWAERPGGKQGEEEVWGGGGGMPFLTEGDRRRG